LPGQPASASIVFAHRIAPCEYPGSFCNVNSQARNYSSAVLRRISITMSDLNGCGQFADPCYGLRPPTRKAAGFQVVADDAINNRGGFSVPGIQDPAQLIAF
jgi:hypothetical protein